MTRVCHVTRVAGGQDPAVPAAAAAQPVISSPASAAQRRHPIQHQVPSQSQQSQSIFSPQKCKNILPPSLHNFPSIAGTRSLSLKFWRTEAWTTDDWREFDVNVPILKTIVSKLYIPFKYKSNICFEYGKLSIIM